MKEVRDQNNSSQQALNITPAFTPIKDNSSSDFLRENLQKQLKGNLDFAGKWFSLNSELFFPKGFLDKNRENIEKNKNCHSPLRRNDLPFVSDKILNRSNIKKNNTGIDLLSQLHDKSTTITIPKNEKTHLSDKTNKIKQVIYPFSTDIKKEVIEVKSSEDHINLLLGKN